MKNKNIRDFLLMVNTIFSAKLIISNILSFIILVLFYYPMSNIYTSFFHDDDVRLISKLSSINSFHEVFQYIFSLEFFKFRPIANIQYLVEYYFFSNNLKYYILYNITLVVIINNAFLLFIYERLSLSTLIALSFIFVTSKFHVYSIWNLTGSFESLAVIILLTIIHKIFTKQSEITKIIAFGFVLILISERYLPFLMVLPIARYYINRNDGLLSSFYINIKYSILIFSMYLVFRLLLGVPVLVGTQTSNITENFSFATFFFHVAKSYTEIWGFSVGPKYLTGFEFASWVPFDALLNNRYYIAGLFISLFLFLISIYYHFFKCFVNRREILVLNIFGLVLITAASVTFRLELRWLLPSYLMLLIIFASFRNFEVNSNSSFNIRRFDLQIFTAFTFVSIIYNVYYALYSRRTLYFAEKLHDSSIFSETTLNIFKLVKQWQLL